MEYPALFVSADRLSLSAQRVHWIFLKLQLALLVLASVLAGVATVASDREAQMLSSVSAFVLAINLLMAWILRMRRYDKLWFDSRAIAESVKSASWRYMMRAAPFPELSDHEHVDEGFLEELKQIRLARPGIETHLAGLASKSTQIPEEMRHIRSASFNDRKELYLKNRLLPEKAWYEGRTQSSRRSSEFWFWAVAVIQAGALILALIVAIRGIGSMGLVAVLMTLAAVSVAWTQARRYEELAQAYGLAAQELGELQPLSSAIKIDSDFAKFVEQIEEAISREHTMWRARRNIPSEISDRWRLPSVRKKSP